MGGGHVSKGSLPGYINGRFYPMIVGPKETLVEPIKCERVGHFDGRNLHLGPGGRDEISTTEGVQDQILVLSRPYQI